MLQAIRDHLTGWVAVILFIVIGLAFALWGVPNQSVANTSPAHVNGEEIPLNEIRRAVRAQLAQFQQYSEVTPEYEQLIRNQVLEGLVMDEVMSQHSVKAGYHIGDKALETHIRNTPAFQDQGQFSLELLRSRLAPQGVSLQYYEEQMRRALRITQLRRGIMETAFVTNDELQQRARLEREQRKAEWLRISPADNADQIEITDEQIQAHYDANPDAYMRPDTAVVSYVQLSLSDIASETSISDEELKAYYDSETAAGRFQAPEERKASHILISVGGDTDEATAREQIDALLVRLQNGEDFATLAAEFSDDPGSGPEGGDLGWAQREAYVGPFADALFSMSPGELSDPVRTQFGYHIIRMEEQRGGVPKPFDEVRDELHAELSLNTAEGDYYDRADQMRDLSFENPSSLQPIADALDLEVVTIDNVSRTGSTGIAANPVFTDAVFSESVLEDQQNSDPFDLSEGTRVVLRVDDFAPAAVRPLEEVRDAIIASLRDEAAREQVAQAGEAVLERLAAGEAMADIAAELNAEHTAAETYRRTSSLPPALQQALFAVTGGGDGPTVEGVALADGSYAVFSLTEIIPGSTDQLGAPASVAGQYGTGDLSAYMLSLREDASVVLRPELLENN